MTDFRDVKASESGQSDEQGSSSGGMSRIDGGCEESKYCSKYKESTCYATVKVGGCSGGQCRGNIDRDNVKQLEWNTQYIISQLKRFNINTTGEELLTKCAELITEEKYKQKPKFCNRHRGNELDYRIYMNMSTQEEGCSSDVMALRPLPETVSSTSVIEKLNKIEQKLTRISSEAIANKQNTTEHIFALATIGDRLDKLLADGQRVLDQLDWYPPTPSNDE